MSDSSDSGMILSATPPTLGNKKSKDVNVSRTRNRDKAGPAVDISDIVNADPAATTTGGDKSTSGTNNNTSGKNLESEMSRTFPPHPPFSTCYGGATTPRDDPSRHYANG
jgi:hypothetical protein